MWLLYIFLAIALAIALTVAADVKWPASKWIKSAKSWQTLIGALLGFLVLAVSISLTSSLEAEQDELRRLNDEYAYLGLVELEHKRFRSLVLSRLESLESKDLENHRSHCFAQSEILERFKIKTTMLDGDIPHIAPKVDPVTIRIMTTMALDRESYKYRLSTILQDSRACVSAPEDTLQRLTDLHRRVVQTTTTTLEILDEHLQSLDQKLERQIDYQASD